MEGRKRSKMPDIRPAMTGFNRSPVCARSGSALACMLTPPFFICQPFTPAVPYIQGKAKLASEYLSLITPQRGRRF